MTADKRNNMQQIIQAVFDEPKQALKTTFDGPIEVEFSGGTQEVEIDASTGDNIALADAVTGNKATIVGGRLQVDTTGTVDADVTIPPSTDYSSQTITATTTWTQLVFADLATVSSIAIKLLGTSTDNLLFAKVASPSGNAFGTLEPGDAIGLPVFKGAQVWYKASTGTGTATFTTTAAN